METPELTTRDVLAQIDRRLTRLEDDIREFRQYVDERFRRIQDHFDNRIDGLSAKVDRNFRWTVSLIMVSWLSTMSAILLK